MPRHVREAPITESAGANTRYRYLLDEEPEPAWTAALLAEARPDGVVDVRVESRPPAVVVEFVQAAASTAYEWAPAVIARL